MVRCITLESKLHLAWLRAVHLDLCQDLIILRVGGLTDVLDAPCETVLERLQCLEEDLERDPISVDSLGVVNDNVDDVDERHF